jgi:hypothetical protein
MIAARIRGGARMPGGREPSRTDSEATRQFSEPRDLKICTFYFFVPAPAAS